jgi:hypothetical protein
MSGRWLSILFVALLVLPSCSKKSASEAGESPEHSEFVQTAEQRLAALDAHIDTLKVQMSIASDQAKAGAQEDIDQLGVERDKAKAKLIELRAASADTWEQAKQDLATSLDSLDAKFDRARARMH